MASYVKYESFLEYVFSGQFDLFNDPGAEACYVLIHSDAPTVATDEVIEDLTEITGTNYSAGGEDITNNMTRAGGTLTMTATDVVWTAGAADWDAGRYVSMWTPGATSGNNLISYWDYGGNFTVGNGETFTVDFGASVMTFA